MHLEKKDVEHTNAVSLLFVSDLGHRANVDFMNRNKSQQYSRSQRDKSEGMGEKYRQKVKNQFWNYETSLLQTEHLPHLFCLGAKFWNKIKII